MTTQIEELENHPLSVWVDVGGTFTDCFVRFPDGRLQKHKTLSSGKIVLRISRTETPGRFRADALESSVRGFWCDATLEFLSREGEHLGSSRVVDSVGPFLLTESPVTLPDSWDGRAALDAGLEAPALALHQMLGVPIRGRLPALHVRLGTTKGTNALLTRTGAKTAVLITAPFEDLIYIGDQTRPNLFDLAAHKIPPVTSIIVPVLERIDASGQVMRPLDVADAERKLSALVQQGVESLAICLLHSYKNPTHERKLAALARKFNFRHISASHELAPLIEIVPRAQTTLVDAYIGPVLREYLRRLYEQFHFTSPQNGGAPFYVMTSAGGLVHWVDYAPKDSILSGPAGGVAALKAIWHAIQRLPLGGFQGLIGLDMGGTSTDVSRVSDHTELQLETIKAGVRLMSPTLDIETVAAGGGSECWFDGVALRVGPQSAGADPGPACYGRGGPLTITDVNVFTGRVDPQQFPFPLDLPAIRRRLEELQREVQSQLGPLSLQQLAEGFRQIANEQMASAVRTVTMAQGADPRHHVLVGFGGAAGQHICEIAELLGIGHVVDPPHAGLLSALGMGYAPLQLIEILPVYMQLHQCDWEELAARSQQIIQRLTEQLLRRRPAGQAAEPGAEITAELRYQGADATVSVPLNLNNHGSLPVDFQRAYRVRYGYLLPDRPVELVSLQIICSLPGDTGLPLPEIVEQGRMIKSDVPLTRSQIRPGDRLVGPLVITSEGSTLCIPTGWTARCLSDATLWVERSAQGVPPGTSVATKKRSERTVKSPAGVMNEGTSSIRPDPVLRECYAARLSAIAAQMGTVLQQTALSVNVKQRRDFSCAIFDRKGRLLANAPHVPVHLGAMGETVRAVIAAFPAIAPGDVYVTNDPYRGGSHLPDVTVISPVFDDQQRLILWVANRAHHADIGGTTPGSMSHRSRRLAEEGVLIEPQYLVQGGESMFQRVRDLLESAPYPPRNVDEVMADLAAQLAANHRGIELLREYAFHFPWQQMDAYAEHLLDAAAHRARQLIKTRLLGCFTFRDYLDHGLPIQVHLEGNDQGELVVDFAGTGPVDQGSFNANPSIVRAAVMYVLRCLMADDFPLNEGVMHAVQLRIPEGLLNPPRAANPGDSPAVAAGNVETSQRVVDVLLGATGAAAASQGTMNNVLFGNREFGFYETICGGAGATPEADGESGVHTHMTNTRLTDPEVLEARYPVRLLEFRLRSGSGGRGRRCGGEGVIREIEFLSPVTVSLLTSRRNPAYPPFPLLGGQPGAIGENWWLRRDGELRRLPGCCEFHAEAGDRLRILTPGGAGYGKAAE